MSNSQKISLAQTSLASKLVPFKDRIIPWYFVMFFAVVAIVNFTMITLALRTHTGLVVTHPYERGLQYNQLLEEAEKQKANGMKGDITFQDHILRVVLHDREGKLIPMKSIRAEFSRPAKEGMDFALDLLSAESKVAFPVSGLWQVRIYAEYDGGIFQKTERIIVQ